MRKWSEATIALVGMATVTVTYKDKRHRLQLLVEKEYGSRFQIRNYRATVNPAVATGVYPLLTLDEAFAVLSGGKYFTKVDLRNAYTQMPVDEAASEVLTVNTPCGLFRVKRLPFGLKAAPGKQVGGADALSRLPLPYNERGIEPQPPEVFLLEIEPHGPFSPADIAQAMDCDSTLAQVRTWISNGYSSGKLLSPFSVFNQHRQSLSVQKNCLLFGNRVVIASFLRRDVLKILHAEHQGIVATKAIARSYVWWPGIRTDIEKIVTNCSTCLAVRPDPPRVIPSSWPTINTSPWNRIHIDFAGPFMGKYFFVAVDASSNWPEAKIVSNVSSASAIRCLREMFSTHG
uniref:RNA-directed DNA polymerase n=1 Tax=Trichuris muris TaxID=70415 RepID=A0A5S6R092_TRIMR